MKKIGLNGAPRNMKNIANNLGKDCIYIYNLTRKA